MSELFQDLRHAVRQLRKGPGFTAVAGITLVLGIGAKIAMFTMIYGVLLRPLPLKNLSLSFRATSGCSCFAVWLQTPLNELFNQ